MDNNFSAQVKEIISFSREEALRLGNDFIGTEHLLLGLIREGENTAVRILKSFNVDLYELRKEVELAVKDKTGKNIANINSLPLTKQAEKVIRVTVLEAKARYLEKGSGAKKGTPRSEAQAGGRVGDPMPALWLQILFLSRGKQNRNAVHPGARIIAHSRNLTSRPFVATKYR